jgi:hypothetical protein
MEELILQLTESLNINQWQYLHPEIHCDHVVIVSPNLNLLEVGVAIIVDEGAILQQWMDQRLITKLSHEKLYDLNSQPQQKVHTLVVEPYVLIQEFAC